MNGLENETILVVDDAAENIALLSDILGDDYRVIFARDGLEALHLAQKTPWHDLSNAVHAKQAVKVNLRSGLGVDASVVKKEEGNG